MFKTLDIDEVSQKLNLSKAVIKRLTVQHVFPDSLPEYKWDRWDLESIEWWSRTKFGKGVLKANQNISSFKGVNNETI